MMSCCVQERSKTAPASIKRHPAQICYNSPPWIWHPQQLRQRHIPSSGASTRSVSTASNPPNARRAVVLAYAGTTSCVTSAGNVAVQAIASTTSCVTGAGNVVAQAIASTTSCANNAGRAVAQAFASTASYATVAPSVKTYRALWKAVHNSVTASAQPNRC